jgi:hypothetical protein
MNKSNQAELFLKKILSVLKPMGKLTVQDEAGAQGIHKDDILFCLIKGNDVYLNNAEVGGDYYFHKDLRLPFRKVENIQNITGTDNLLQYATQSYWTMAGLRKK